MCVLSSYCLMIINQKHHNIMYVYIPSYIHPDGM